MRCMKSAVGLVIALGIFVGCDTKKEEPPATPPPVPTTPKSTPQASAHAAAKLQTVRDARGFV